MYFRSRKKLQGEVSLSDSIETDQDGNDLMLMDVVGVDDTMLSDLQDREDSVLVRRLVRECLTEREREIVTLRYGLGGRMPRTQREIAKTRHLKKLCLPHRKAGAGKARRSHRRARLTLAIPRRSGYNTTENFAGGEDCSMYYIGIDLGGTNIKGALVSETGEIAREVSRPTRVGLGAEAVCDGIAAVITELSSGVDRTSLGGVGLGCPGTVDDETGRVLYANNLGWKNFDLRAEVKSRTGFDLRIGNDANVAALAEALVGCAKGAQSAVIVTLGTGVGGGVVLDGKMLTGYTGAASELGHMVIRAGGEECTCGRRGCFEAYASATALIRETKRAMAAHPESRMHAAAEENGAVDGRTAFIAAQRGDAAAQAVVDRYLDDLACGVANIVNIFFPEVIALSGGVANQGDALLVPLRERVRALSYGSRYAVRHTRIELCTLGYRAGVIGAALLAKQS